MTYTLFNGPVTSSSVTANYSAVNDDRDYSVRISIHNTTTGALLLGSTVIAVGATQNGNVTSSGLSPSTTYNIQMIIRRASNYEYLGERNLSLTTDAAPPPPQVTVPNVLGQYESTARANIEAAGLVPYVTYVFTEIPGATYGTVSSQDPSGGTQTDQGSAVYIDIYSYVPPPPEPSWDSTANFPDGKINSAYYSARTASNANSVSSTSTNAPGLTATSGTVSGKPAVIVSGTPTAAGNYTVSATATGDGGSKTLSVGLYVAPLAPPSWSDTSLSSTFYVGQSYEITSGGNNTVSATNNASFSLVSGTFPAGTYGTASSGTLSILGSPTSKGPYSFTLRAYNNDGIASPDINFSGNVTHPPTWTDQTLAGFEVGRAYSDSLSVSTSDSITWSITSGALPTGVTTAVSGTNNNTITLSGTPTVAGSYTFTIRATNVDGFISKTFSGTVALVPNWVDNELGSFVEGITYSDFVEATNSPTYSVSAGTLPTGISLNTNTGEVSGTPTVLGESFSFTITATTTGGSVSQAFSGSVQPDLGGGIKVFDGSAWGNKEIYAYDGADWVLGKVYRYNGSIWVKSLF